MGAANREIGTMRLLKTAIVSTVLVMLGPSCANAAEQWILSFTGIQPGGNPLAVNLLISDYLTIPYVGYFSLPGVPTASGTTRLNTPANETVNSLLSTVNLSASGGSISIGPSIRYEEFYDGYFILNLVYTLGSPQPIGATFVDNGISGSGSYSYYVNASYGHPGVSDYFGRGSFTLSSLAAEAPEPTTWATMILGLGGVGGMLRRRRATTMAT
jgi:hypothetical protein